MSYPEVVLLAVLQGIAEFLPVSSSGHLVLLQYGLGGAMAVNVLYDVILHAATAVSIIAYFYRDYWGLLRGLFTPGVRSGHLFAGCERKTLALVFVASVPTAILGLGAERWILGLLMRPDLVGAMLVITGGLLWWGRVGPASRAMRVMNVRDAFIIGVLQGVGVIPGISRSGITITGAIRRGLEGDAAVAFSLLISLPAIFGAAALELWRVGGAAEVAPGPYLLGAVVAMVTGYWSIGLISRLVRRCHFHWFALYLWPMGMASVLCYHLLG